MADDQPAGLAHGLLHHRRGDARRGGGEQGVRRGAGLDRRPQLLFAPGRWGPFSWTTSVPATALAASGSNRSASVLWVSSSTDSPSCARVGAISRRPARTRSATSG